MKKTRKRFTAYAVMLAMVAGLFSTLPTIPTKAAGEESLTESDEVFAVHQGKDGAINWSIDSNGCLTLEGNGDWEGLSDSFVIIGDEESKNPKWLDYSNDIVSAKVNVADITNCKDMFYGCSEMQTVDLTNMDTSNVTSMEMMFYGCSQLQTLDLSTLDTSKVVTMEDMFAKCRNLSSINFDHFSTSSVKNMWGMFQVCENITSLDLSSFDTSSVTEMGAMFNYCKSLKEVDVSSFDTSSVTTIDAMFDCCDSLIKLDLSSFDLANLDCDKYACSFSGFNRCTSLTEIQTPKNIPATIGDSSMNDCLLPPSSSDYTSWKDEQGTVYEKFPTGAENSITLKREVTDNAVTETKLSGKSGDLYWNVDANGKLTITGNGDFDYYDEPQWQEAGQYIKSCVVNVTGLTNAEDMFANLPYLQSIEFENFDTSNVTTMNGMFYGDRSLKEIDLSGFNTGNVTDMSYMFGSCSTLKKLDLRNMNTGKCEDFGRMFRKCRQLEQLALQGWNTDNAGDWGIADMFEGCNNLRRLQLDSFSTKGIGSLQAVFECCHKLTNLDISSWDLENLDVDYADSNKSCLSGCVSLSQIKAPVNVKMDLPLPDGKWTDEAGNEYTMLPKNLQESVLLKNREKVQYDWETLSPLPTPTPALPTSTPTQKPTDTPPTTVPTKEPTDNHPSASTNPSVTASPSGHSAVRAGQVVTVKKLKYKVTKVNKNGTGEVALNGTIRKKSDKKFTILKIGNTIKIKGKSFKVTTIGKNAFKGCAKLKKVTLGKNITVIKANAFKGCKNLTAVNCKAKLKKVVRGAFKGTKKIKVTGKSAKANRKLIKKSGAKVK